MKKLKNYSFILIFLVIGNLLISTTDANDGIALLENNELKFENIKLKQEYEKLTIKLNQIETYISEIQRYDNTVYAQMLGYDFDTTKFKSYYNNNMYSLKSQDTIFTQTDERAFYANEMLEIQLIRLQETSTLFTENKNVINYYPTISPIKASNFIRVSSPFGFRLHPIKGEVIYHEGIDISAIQGTPIYSTAQGHVIEVKYSNIGYGNCVLIEHEYGFETLYAHMDIIDVEIGQWISKNQEIGTVGNTGSSTGAHLHYEVRKNKQPHNPLNYFYMSITDNLLAMK